MNRYWRLNLDALKQFKPQLYEQIKDWKYRPAGDFIETPSRILTLRYKNLDGGQAVILAHNNQNPRQDVVGHLQTVPSGSRGLVVFIGMGLGYGPLLVQHERSEVQQIVILEPSLDLFCTVLTAIDITALISSEKVTFFVGDISFDAFEAVISRLAALEDTHILRHAPSFQWDYARYSSVNDQAFMLINQLNVQGGTSRSSGSQFFRNRLANLTLLRHSHKLDSLKDLFRGKPAVVVAAGPSLSQSLPRLKELAGRCVLIAADSALAPLHQAGIMPDFVTSIDFQEINFEKLGPFIGKQWPLTLVSMIKSTPLVPKRFQARHHFLAFPEDRPHDWIIDTLGIKTLAPNCFSVAHLSLGIALIMGADPIIFVGQDLAFTSETSDHAKGTILAGSGTPTDKEMFSVDGIGGGKVQTDRAFLGLKKNFEDILAENPRNYINASAAGAHIEGTRVVDLATVQETFLTTPLAVSQTLEEALQDADYFPTASFLDTGHKILSLIKKIKGQLADSLVLSSAARKQLVKLKKNRIPGSSLEDLPEALIRSLQKFDKLNNALDEQDPLWQQVLELTFEMLSENDRQREQNDLLRDNEGYLSWLLAEIERIDEVNRNRTEALATYQKQLSRLIRHLEQEEKLLARAAKKETEKDLLALLQLYSEAGDLSLAKEVGERLLAQAPDNAGVHLLMGEICAGLIDIEAARKHWQRVLAIEPAMKTQISQAQQQAVLPWLVNAEKCGDRYPRLLAALLQRIFATIDDKQGALPDLLQELWRGHCEKIDASLAAKNVDQAKEILAPWETVQIILPAYLYWKARCLAATGDNSSALKTIAKALEQTPDKSEWMAFMAKLLIEEGRFDDGLLLLNKAVEADPQTAALWEELGDSLISAGDFTSAAIAYERCFVALPDRVDALRKIGDCYLYNKQPQAAIAAYHAVLQKEPDHQDARRHLKKAQETELMTQAGRPC